jgi:hypothetical protein
MKLERDVMLGGPKSRLVGGGAFGLEKSGVNLATDG